MLSPWHVKIVVKVHGEEDLVREAGFRTRLGAKQLVASIAMNQLEALYRLLLNYTRFIPWGHARTAFRGLQPRS